MERVVQLMSNFGFAWMVPLVKLVTGQDAGEQIKVIWQNLGIPILAFCGFLLAWNIGASGVKTSLGEIPSPGSVWIAFTQLVDDHLIEREKAAAFFERQRVRNEQKLASDPNAIVKIRNWTGKPTYFDQILTSLLTVSTGFLFAAMVAVPLGILCGVSSTAKRAFNPLIQLFKPVSPLAWLPIVTLVVSAVYVTSDDAWFAKSFITSAITVTLCCLWPALMNTALGVSSVDKDLTKVAQVLQLGWWTRTTKLILPSSLPLIFTGLRLSLGVGWMVLIAAEMLAQNPGLGKFVWDEFQNGSSESLARIMVAVFTIGLIGFLLDRLMLTLQNLVTFERSAD